MYISGEKPAIELIVAGVADVPKLVELFEAYRAFYQQKLDLAAARTFLELRLQEGSATVFLALQSSAIAPHQKQPVGFALLYPSFSSLSLKPLWLLSDLFVKPEARRAGVGRLLLERSRQLAEETQAEGLLLQTAQDNIQAQRLYESQGWQRETVFLTYNLFV